MNTLLVLGAGRLNLSAARAMSSVARVIAVDRSPFEYIEEPSFKTIALDFSDQEKLLKFAEKESVSGVYPFSDHAIRPAAMISKTLGLVGLQGQVAENFLDKSRMRVLWGIKGLSQPTFSVVYDLKDALQAASYIGYPVIIKPASSGGGGRGVFRVESDDELRDNFFQAVKENRYSECVLVEKFIEGVESSLELVFVDGSPILLAISTKQKPRAKSQVATEIVYPGDLSDDLVNNIRNLCVEAAMALGIVSGATHFEVITTSEGVPYLIEVGGRVGGGHTFHPITSHVSGVNYPELIAYLYLGRFDEVRSILASGVLGRGAVYSFPVSNMSGTIKSIGFAEIGCDTFVESWKQPGNLISGMSSSMDRLGCVVSLADTPAAALRESRTTMLSFFMNLES
jgi:biotin carboxylase